MRNIEAELITELDAAMKRAGKTQADFATFKGASRQAVNPYFTGRKALLTETAQELFEFLGVRIKLEPIEG